MAGFAIIWGSIIITRSGGRPGCVGKRLSKLRSRGCTDLTGRIVPMASKTNGFPIDTWSSDMEAAIDQITRLGNSILDAHGRAGQQAAENAERWHLPARLEDERRSLRSIITHVRQIIESIVACRECVHSNQSSADEIDQTINHCADTIEACLPGIEQGFVTSRRAALDLLQWTQRSARIEGSTLPGEYRASYAASDRLCPDLQSPDGGFPGGLASTQRRRSLASRCSTLDFTCEQVQRRDPFRTRVHPQRRGTTFGTGISRNAVLSR